MRALSVLAVAALVFSTAASASEAAVNASESRKPIPQAIYERDLGDEARQAELAATYAIDLPVGELARVALLGTFGQKSVAPVFSEGPVAPPPSTPAIALFTNYDGEGARFGDTSIQTTATNPLLSVFASFDLDANVTVVLLNKSPEAADAVALGFKGIGQKGSWRAFELTADGKLNPAGTGTIYDALLIRTVQPYTAQLIEFRPVGGILPIRTPPPAESLPSQQRVEQEAAPEPTTGCSAAGTGLSLALVGLIGLLRRRSAR